MQQMTRTLLLIFLTTSGAYQSIAEQSREPPLSHVVLVWLKEPGNHVAINRITEASHGFKAVPGVLSVQVGKPAPSERPIVDDSFDLGIIISFPDKAAMNRYLTHPIHRDAVHDIIKPLTRKILVYDIQH